jgi:hypothetical protein
MLFEEIEVTEAQDTTTTAFRQLWCANGRKNSWNGELPILLEVTYVPSRSHA